MSALAELGARLPAVTLEELNATAALLTRTDRKYVLPTAELAPFLGELRGAAGVRALEIEGRRVSRYASTYFDTVDLDGWSASAHPRRRRWKVRTRVYADSGECWLELKTRGGRGQTVKLRAEHPLAERESVAPAEDWLDAEFAAAAVPVRARDLVTTLSTTYDRATWLLGSGRVTLDEGLRFGAGDRTLGVGEVVVVETKSDSSGPGTADRALWRRGHRPVRISKYGTGMCVLHPSLPANRWHRVLNRDLGLTAPQQGAAA